MYVGHGFLSSFFRITACAVPRIIKPQEALPVLYKFKSSATGDVLMLEPHARQMLALWGRTSEEAQRRGILLHADIPAAIAALEEAVAHDEARRIQAALEAQTAPAPKHPSSDGETEPHAQQVHLRQRATPLLEMARRCFAAGKDITWGV
jgi:hypothetical protein